MSSISSVSQPVDTQPLPEPAVSKPDRTLKAPAIQHAVANLRLLGHSLREIAEKTNLSVNTVRKIIRITDVDTIIKSAKQQCADLAPKAIKAIDKALDKGSENAAFRLLEGIGVLGDVSTSANKTSDGSINIAIANLLPSSQRAPQLAESTLPRDVIDVPSTSPSTPPAQD